jgi:phosphoribosylamine-glycine ligase
MNIMSLFGGDWAAAMEHICAGRLTAEDVPLREEASLVLYLVSPDYALAKHPAAGAPGGPYEFDLDVDAIEAQGCRVFFSSAVNVGVGSYRTVGTSRAVALATTAPTLETARERVVGCARSIPVLEWRRDVGRESYLDGLAGLVAHQPA